MTPHNERLALRGITRGPFTLQYTAMKLQCPVSFVFEVAYDVDINVYADMVTIDWHCRGCVAGNSPYPACHTAILPAPSYVSPDTQGNQL